MTDAMSTRVDAVSPGLAATDVRALRRAALWALLGAKLLGGWGVPWDIRWHLLVGRDSFWIPPHVMTYAGVTLTVLLAFGVLVTETIQDRRGVPAPGRIRIAGLVGTRGFHLAGWGVALTVLAAPVDDLWHRLFGIDVTLWSPPHLLGMAGAQLNTLGCLLIAVELWPARSRSRRAALLAGATLMLGAFSILVDPAVQTAFRHGGVFFFTWAALGAPAFAFTLALAAQLTGLRSAPLLLALGALALHWVGIGLADAGFALTRPTPAIAAAIAADPGSPIALAHEMARRNGTVPGRAMTLRLLPVAAAALMTLVDARRRWAAASLALGLGLVVMAGVTLARLPAFAHALPGPGDVAVAGLAAALAALAGGAGARRLAAWMRPLTSPE
jgi:hypothetical protein